MVVRAEVGAKPKLSEVLTAQVEGGVKAINLGATPCDRCIRNAESADPVSPPLHPHCHCKWTTVPMNELITVVI